MDRATSITELETHRQDSLISATRQGGNVHGVVVHLLPPLTDLSYSEADQEDGQQGDQGQPGRGPG